MFGNSSGIKTEANQNISHKQAKEHKERPKNAPYASFDCPECIQMATLMLEEELKFYMQRNSYRKGGSKGRSNSK